VDRPILNKMNFSPPWKLWFEGSFTFKT
jgi:hypothetical protein